MSHDRVPPKHSVPVVSYLKKSRQALRLFFPSSSEQITNMVNYTLVYLFSSQFILSSLLTVAGLDWQLKQGLFDKIKAACEDEDVLNPDHSSRLASEQIPASVSRYPAPKTYAGWQPPRPIPEALSSDQLAQGSDQTSTTWDKILDRLSDSRVSPAERVADYGKIAAVWGQDPPAYPMTGLRWRSFCLFRNLWRVSQGLVEVSSNFERILYNYLSRNRAKPLVGNVMEGLTHALSSDDAFEKMLAKNLRTHILVEDLGQ